MDLESLIITTASGSKVCSSSISSATVIYPLLRASRRGVARAQRARQMRAIETRPTPAASSTIALDHTRLQRRAQRRIRLASRHEPRAVSAASKAPQVALEVVAALARYLRGYCDVH